MNHIIEIEHKNYTEERLYIVYTQFLIENISKRKQEIPSLQVLVVFHHFQLNYQLLRLYSLS